jgi:hypothetical protein
MFHSFSNLCAEHLIEKCFLPLGLIQSLNLVITEILAPIKTRAESEMNPIIFSLK